MAGRASPEPSLPSSTDDQLSPSSARFWVNLRGRLALRICTRPGSLARHPHPRLARGTSSAACAHSSSSSRSSTALLGGGVRVRLGVHSSRRSSAAQTGAARSRKRRLSERATLARRAGRRGGFKSLGGGPRGPLCSLARALLFSTLCPRRRRARPPPPPPLHHGDAPVPLALASPPSPSLFVLRRRLVSTHLLCRQHRPYPLNARALDGRERARRRYVPLPLSLASPRRALFADSASLLCAQTWSPPPTRTRSSSSWPSTSSASSIASSSRVARSLRLTLAHPLARSRRCEAAGWFPDVDFGNLVAVRTSVGANGTSSFASYPAVHEVDGADVLLKGLACINAEAAVIVSSHVVRSIVSQLCVCLFPSRSTWVARH